MLGSSHHHHHEEEEEVEELLVVDPYRRSLTSTSSTSSPPIHMRQLLIRCAELISRSDLSAAHRLISILSTNSSPYGDSTERLVHQFTKALSLRLNRTHHFYIHNNINNGIPPIINIHHQTTTSTTTTSESEVHQYSSAYLSLNQVTPFIRFTHLTANQAILEAIDGQQNIHILDLDIMQGVQWPPLMQALAERYPPPTLLRITGTGNDINTLRRTGDRLARFAHSLGLRFQFHPAVINNNNNVSSRESERELDLSSILFLAEEALAVNCVHYLHRLLKDGDKLRLFLGKIKAVGARVLTVGERELGNLQHVEEAIDHYAAVFDSLEATLPPNSRERLEVEQIWLGREIEEVVDRERRHERLRWWEVMLRRSGFRNVALSPFALSQAKLLLRLHYPSEGYQLHVLNHAHACFLGWQNQPLFSVSSWQ
ncbi:hypothetical protein ACJIZ3_012945 [Penstemon smallii]|uniref:Uncharacterized protein n=1 Tax=Penstemon smallii TaxID=265156 RepID=A0ABD3URB9_9LAMI